MRRIDLTPTADEAYTEMAAREAAYLAAHPPAPLRIERGHWVPACGGTETPFRTRTGRTLLYCWNNGTGEHAYLDTGTDLILSDEEARAALAL